MDLAVVRCNHLLNMHSVPASKHQVRQFHPKEFRYQSIVRLAQREYQAWNHLAP